MATLCALDVVRLLHALTAASMYSFHCTSQTDRHNTRGDANSVVSNEHTKYIRAHQAPYCYYSEKTIILIMENCLSDENENRYFMVIFGVLMKTNVFLTVKRTKMY